MPNFNESSEAIRSSPQVTFSFTILAMSWRISVGRAGLRIPSHADQDSEVMPIRIPRSCRSGFRDHADQDSESCRSGFRTDADQENDRIGNGVGTKLGTTE